MFADLCNFTALTRSIDVEELHDLVGRFTGLVDRIVEDYGGTIDKHVGDAVMALFGAPIAHGDDPVRAIRAAVDIHAAVEALGTELGRRLEAHIGIADGEVVAGGLERSGRLEYTVLGNSVNLAARLQALARQGETVVSETVQRAVAGIADCESIGAPALKGFEHPVHAWRVRGLSAGPASPRTPFVGRQAEIAQFVGLIDACQAGRAGQTVLVRGDAGIGKSRLLSEFQQIARQRGFVCHTGLVLDFGVGSGDDAIEALARSLLNVQPGSDAETRRAAVERALADGLVDPEHHLFLNEWLDVEQTSHSRAVYDAMDHRKRGLGKQATLAALVRGAARHQPVVVTIEDLHWATPPIIAQLAAIGAVVAECPAVLVMSTRTEGDPLDQYWRVALRSSPVTTIDIPPLRPDEAMQLASSFVDITSQTIQRRIERAGGNPLFLEHLLAGIPDESDEVPATIQGIIQARIDRLSPDDRQAIQVAAIIGQRFSGELLSYLLHDADYDCRSLIEHGLVCIDGGDFLFAHALIQESVYSSLLRRRRRELHNRAAEWFVNRDAVLRAEHLDRAEDDTAPKAYLSAALGQLSRYRLEEAQRLVNRGLELVSDRETEWELAWLQGEVLREIGAIEESIAAYRRALGVADNEIRECRARIGLSSDARLLERYDQALELLDSAEIAATERNLTEERAQIHYHRASIYFRLVNADACLEQANMALAYAKQCRSPEHEARALSVSGDAHYMRGRMITAHSHYRRCVELARRRGLRRIEVANLHMRGLTRYFQNELKQALKDTIASAKAAAELGQYRAEMIARGITGGTLLEMGQTAGAEHEFEKALGLARTYGARSYEPISLVGLGRILALKGNRSEALRYTEEAIAISREAGMKTSGPRALGALALITEDSKIRDCLLAEGEAVLREGSISHHYISFYRDAIEASLESGHWQSVYRYASALEDYTRSEPLPLSDFFTARGRLLATFYAGKRDPEIIEQLQYLEKQGQAAGLTIALRRIEEALSLA